MNNFLEKLKSATQTNRSLLCVGLDPVLPLMPINDLFVFNREIIDATKDIVCAYKPQMAFYEAQGIPGLTALEKTLNHIPKNIPVILDSKRGDIGSTSEAYATAMFDIWGADATTVNPYLGTDSLEPFLAYKDRGVFILIRTSNPGSVDIQDLEIQTSLGKEPLYQQVARLANQWNFNGNVGGVVGATYIPELQAIRTICPDIPILIPGIGTQGGDLGLTIKNGVDHQGRLAIITVSRQIIYASKEPNFAIAARTIAEDLRKQINDILENMSFPW